jgi:hypothetical protein
VPHLQLQLQVMPPSNAAKAPRQVAPRHHANATLQSSQAVPSRAKQGSLPSIGHSRQLRCAHLSFEYQDLCKRDYLCLALMLKPPDAVHDSPCVIGCTTPFYAPWQSSVLHSRWQVGFESSCNIVTSRSSRQLPVIPSKKMNLLSLNLRIVGRPYVPVPGFGS